MPHSPGKNLSFMIRSVFETFPDIPALLQQTAALYNPAQSAASVHPPVVSLPEEPLNHTREDHHRFLSDAALLHQSDCFPEILINHLKQLLFHLTVSGHLLLQRTGHI